LKGRGSGDSFNAAFKGAIMAEHPQVLADRIMGQLNGGQFKAAFKTARGAAKAYPSEAFFFNLAGMALAQSGDEREAAQWFRKALRLTPQNPDIQGNLLKALINTGQGKIARDLIAKMLTKRKDKAALWFLEALSWLGEGQPHKAEASLDLALQENPRMANALNLRGVTRFEQGREAQALADYESALAIDPNAPDCLSNLSIVLDRLHRPQEALEAVEKAVSLNPRHVIAVQRLAVMQNEFGRKDDARATYRRLLNLAPGHSEALLELALMHEANDRAALIAQVSAALKVTRKNSAEAGLLGIAMGHLLLKSGDLSGSDSAFAAGNAAFAAPARAVTDQAAAMAEKAMALCPDTNTPAASPADPRPVFVLGLPRSGTTLVEQMLSAHPSVFGAGELPFAGRLMHDTDAPFGAQTFAAHYRTALPPMPEGTQAFVDKMPSNFMYIGPLLAAFPNAAILHIRRDPRDVALSMWRTWFSAPAMAYTCDQAQMARYINLYARCMAHWQALFGDRITHIDYEQVVADPEGQSKRMAMAAGLDWVPDMAAPEKNTAQVLTASVNQVREGVHKRSVGGWRAHADALKQLRNGLDPALWPDLD